MSWDSWDKEITTMWGALLERGAEDWQVFQQDARGLGSMSLEGRWAAKPGMGGIGTGGEVQVRLLDEGTGAPVGGLTTWLPAETRADGTWSLQVRDIPAGGPYRLETRFSPKGNKLGEWSWRGDMRHFLGVGDIWVVAGQSNAAGYGRAPAGDGPEIGLHVLRQDGRWALASHPLHDGTALAFPDFEDAAGIIPVEGAVFYRRDSVRLDLARAASGTVRLSCGYGEDPDTLPVDVERQMPILACHAFPVSLP